MAATRTDISWAFVPAIAARPGERPLDRLKNFLNTLRLEEGIDRLADAAQAEEWLATQGYPGVALGPRRLSEYRKTRETVRSALRGSPDALREVAQLVEQRAPASAALEVDGGWLAGVRPREVPADRRPLQDLLLALWRGAVSGELARLKVCADDRCRLVFYDRSRNRTRTWCTSGQCGNRNRVARHRLRQSV